MFKVPKMLLVLAMLGLFSLNIWSASNWQLQKSPNLNITGYNNQLSEKRLAESVSFTFKFRVYSFMNELDSFLVETTSHNEGGVEILLDEVGQLFLRISLATGATLEIAILSVERNEAIKLSKWYQIDLQVDKDQKILEIKVDGDLLKFDEKIASVGFDEFTLRLDDLRLGHNLRGEVKDFELQYSVKSGTKSPSVLATINLFLVFICLGLLITIISLKKKTLTNFKI